MRVLRGRWASAAAVVAVSLMLIAGSASANNVAGRDTVTTAKPNELTSAKAVVLGVIEGITEFLPVSSTGHLTVAERIMDVGQVDATRDVTKSYTVMIQIGAILAVVLLFWGRIIEIVQGLFGRSAPGRRLLVALIVAFVPAAVIGKGLEEPIEKHLFGAGPVAAAWIVGGVVILIYGRVWRTPSGDGRSLETITSRQALVIGVAQALALWPGVSRSLATILAALACGLTMSAAIEFSFLLGLATLSAATGYEMVRHGSEVTSTFGWSGPIIGVVAAGVSAAIAVKWMVGYLGRHSLDVFGYYRIAAGVVVVALLATRAI